MPSTRSKRLFATVVFLGSIVVLAMQLINPSPVMVTVGDDGREVVELGSYFQYRDVALIAVVSCLLGISGTYLLLATDSGREEVATEPVRDPRRAEPAPEPEQTGPTAAVASADGSGADVLDTDRNLDPSDEFLEARREEWEETAEQLANKEREVYETLVDADGVCPQSEIVEETDLSKASVSRALDSLEVGNLVERKRRGMGNIVYLL